MIPTQKDETPTLLFNPSKKDFTCQMANDEDTPQLYTLPSRKIVTFPKYIADHVAKHLARKLAQENAVVMTEEGPVRAHFDERVKIQLQKIFIQI